MEYLLNINNESKTVDAEPGTPLLWVLRDELKLTGTKFGCGVASCGACTVHLNGSPVRSCSFPVESAVGQTVTTIEGVSGTANDVVARSVQKAWLVHDVVQCGYCQSGQIMSAIGLLKNNPTPSDEEIDSAMSGNVCRCATYVRVKAAIKTAAETL